MVYGLQTEKRIFHQIIIHHRTIHFMLAFSPQFLPNELKIRKTASSSFLPFLVFLLSFLYEKSLCIHHSFPFFRFTFYHTSKEHCISLMYEMYSKIHYALHNVINMVDSEPISLSRQSNMQNRIFGK